MTLTNVPVDFIGGENKSRSKLLASEENIGMYVSRPGTGRTPAALLPWPGEKSFSSGTAADQRGGHVMNGMLYVVNDQTLYSVAANGAKTSLGTIAGTTRCSFTDDGVNLIIRTSLADYVYNGSTVSAITDTDLSPAQSCTILNNQVIYQLPGNQFAVAQVNVPTDISSLDIGTAEYYPDDIRQLFTFREQLFIAGANSTEVWYNTGTDNPPFSRIQSSTSNIGVASAFTMANTEDYIYFVGSNSAVYRQSSYQPEIISPESICKELRERVTSDALGRVVKWDGMNFYIIQLPSSNYTLAYCEQTNTWTRLGSGNPVAGHLLSDYFYCYGKHLIAVQGSSAIYEWDADTYDSAGNTLIRQRVSAPINGAKLGVPGKRLTASKFNFIVETGVGDLTTTSPKMMVDFSIDGGRSYRDENWLNLGAQNESAFMVTLNKCISFYDLVIRIRVSDPVFFSVHGGSVELRVSGV